MMWLIDSVSKRYRGSGVRKEFAVRLAEECIAVVEGRSALWEKRVALHKSGVMARTNVNYKRGNRRKRV
jgi:small subunit ribosomal protein S7